jgi:hypothetical protein
MRPVTVTVGPLTAASGNNIALSQTPGGAGNLTLNGALVTAGVANIGNAQRITLTTADATHTATITGTDAAGSPISETVALNGTAVTTVLSYKTVTQISVNAALTGAITAGTSGVGTSAWVRFDEWASAQVAIQCDTSGTVSYTIQQTLDDPNSPTNPVAPALVTWVNSSDTNAVGATGPIQSNYAFAPTFARVLLNSGGGTVTATFVQLGVAPY